MDQANLNLRILKEPRGMIRVIQFVFAILAFATTVGFSYKSAIEPTSECNGTGHADDVPYRIEYPFSATLDFSKVLKACSISASELLDYKTSAEFYVTVGVLSLLYTLGITVLYVMADQLYQSNPLIPVIDLVATIVLTVFWFIAWCAWVANVGNIKGFQAGLLLKVCKPNQCVDHNTGKWAGLTVSLIFGFGNILLWAASLWFVYKETHFHNKPDTSPPGPGGFGDRPQNPQQIPTRT